MYKVTLMGLLLAPLLGFANSPTPNSLIGKWQCQTKQNDPLVTEASELQFLKNGTLNENIRILYGQKGDYTHQIESATAQSTWTLDNDVLHYDNYRFYNYKVRMPNANKDDIEQANIALQKSLPMIHHMASRHMDKKQFDISFINKKSFIMNDIENQVFSTCHKKGFFDF